MLKSKQQITSDNIEDVVVVAEETDDNDNITYNLELPQGISIPFSADFAVDAGFFGMFMDRLSTLTATEFAEIQTRMRQDLAAQASLDQAGENLENSASDGGDSVADTRKFGYTVSNGIAVVPLTGLMTKRPSCMGWLLGEGTSTVGVMRALRHADANPDVDSKFLLVDSPGGEVSGSFDLSNMVRNGKKPTDAHIEDLGASAAYLAASGARNISANENAAVGSIGVYTKLVDNTAAMEARGYKVHLVKAGKHKAIGETGVPITADHIDHVQKRVDSIHSLFLRSVMKGRNEMSKAQLSEVADAGVFIGKQAHKMGLVDGISDTPTALRKSMQLNKDNVKSKGNDRMVKDDDLRAMLAGEPAATAEPENPDNATETTPAPAATETNPLLATLTAMGVKTPEDLRGLAGDALSGRTYLAEQRELALKLAGVALNGTDPANAATMASVTSFINAAPLEVVQGSIVNYRASASAQGLTPEKPRQTAPNRPAHAASIETEATDTAAAADPVAPVVKRNYDNHPILGGTK